MNDVERIVIDTGSEGKCRVVGNLKKCSVCETNFSAFDPCVMCQMRIDKEKELGRRMTQDEWDELFAWLR